MIDCGVNAHSAPDTTGAALAAGAVLEIPGATVATRNMTKARAPVRSQLVLEPADPASGDVEDGGTTAFPDLVRPVPPGVNPIGGAPRERRMDCPFSLRLGPSLVRTQAQGIIARA